MKAVLSMCRDMGLPDGRRRHRKPRSARAAARPRLLPRTGLPVRTADTVARPRPRSRARHRALDGYANIAEESPDDHDHRPLRIRLPRESSGRRPCCPRPTHDLILAGLATHDVRRGGLWWSRVGTWRRYATPWITERRRPRRCRPPRHHQLRLRQSGALLRDRLSGLVDLRRTSGRAGPPSRCATKPSASPV